jgi:hypothetical protein
VAEPLDDASRSKVLRALDLHEEVNDFLTSMRPRELASATELQMGHADSDAVDDRSLSAGRDDSSPNSSSDALSRQGSLKIEKRRFRFVEDQLILDHDAIEARAEGKWFSGRVLEVAHGKVIQSVGRGLAAIHDASHLDKIPSIGDAVSIVYHRGRGNVLQLIVSREHDLDRAADSSRRHDTTG